MEITSLEVRNYRRFDRFSIDLHPALTVIAARNGLGKTTVLEALAIALGPFVGAFDEGRATSIAISDVRREHVGVGPENEKKFPVEVTAHFSGPNLTSTREKRTVGAPQPRAEPLSSSPVESSSRSSSGMMPTSIFR